MITLDDVMPLVLEACPAFLPVLEADYSKYHIVPGSEPFYYSEAGILSSWLYERLESHETACFPAVFALIERLFAEGNDQVQTLAALGILEVLQNTANYAAHSGNGHTIFFPWLGPLTRKEWDALF